MPEGREAEVAELVKTALEHEAAEWPQFLDAHCPAELRSEVESLLGYQKHAARFIEQPAVQIAAEMLTTTLRPGDVIEQYRVESLIGSGGMGEVYLATDTVLKRRVALKLVQRGLNSQEILRRFRHEEEILAGLNHPNIAQLYGTGLTAEGIPFFAMEYVEGTRLDRFCSERALDIHDRLQLFRKVCSAVAYAHQHLVIHRDLKPANIRVTAEGEPKLLDFGIAKIVDAAAAIGAEHTLTIDRVMTPEYASPEQVRGELMTTASDVYSLGVVLYELLTGEKPYRLKTRTADEVSRAILEQQPPRPSTANAHQSNFEPRNAKILRGDLDNIVLMAMRKEPERRYASVAQFSDDIRRHLEGRTVLARKDTLGYRTSKFIRRNKLGVAAAALVFLSLAGGIVATTYEARRAQRRFNDVRRLANSLMFEIHDSVQDLPGSTPTRRLIVDRALQYLDSLNNESSGDASLQRELATAYEKVGDIQGNPYFANLGDTEGALASYRKATAIREGLGKRGADTEAQVDLARSYRGLGDILEQKGDIAGCLQEYRRSLEVLQRAAAAAPNDSNAQVELGRAYEALGDGLGRTAERTERLSVYRQGLAIRERLRTQDPADLKHVRGTALAHLKVASVAGVPKEEVIEHMNHSIPLLEQLSAADPQNARARREVGYAYYAFGRALSDAGDELSAATAREKSLAIREEMAAQDPKNKQAQFDLAAALGELAEGYVNLGRAAEGLEQSHRCVEVLKELTALDAGNAIYSRNLAFGYEHAADAAAAIGRDQALPVEQRIARLTEARDSYQQADNIFADLRTRGALMPNDSGQVDKFTAKVSETQHTLDELAQ